MGDNHLSRGYCSLLHHHLLIWPGHVELLIHLFPESRAGRRSFGQSIGFGVDHVEVGSIAAPDQFL